MHSAPTTSVSLSAADDRSRKDRQRHWSLYAAAAGAALAMASTAEASIIYVNPATPPDAKLPGAAPFNGTANVAKTFLVDGLAASVDIRRFVTGNGSHRPVNAAYGKLGAGLIANASGGTPLRFAAGAPISVGSNTLVGRGFLQYRQNAGGGGVASAGNFGNNQTGFAGFQLPGSKGGGLGWIRYEVIDRNSDTYADEVKAIDWAYNDAGGGIVAGQEVSSGTPEPSALALLALGSVGVLAWRRRRPAQKDQAAA